MNMKFTSKDEYLRFLNTQASLPEGFKVGVSPLTFVPEEKKTGKELKMNMSMILLDNPVSSYTAMFTRNAFPGAPVVIGRQRLGRQLLQGLLINNKISNVCVKSGVEDAIEVTSAVEEALKLDSGVVFPSSTGIIGWRLPVAAMKSAVPTLVESIGGNLLDLAQAIMTTDAYPKIVRRDFCGGSIAIVGKGAGMIEPNLATMLVYIMTDFCVDQAELEAKFPSIINESFNRISIDSDQSTSDSVYLLSSGKKKVESDLFFKNLAEASLEMANSIVRNGEGTAHVIEVSVLNSIDKEFAASLGKAVVNSPLVKSAIFGNDPNVGRIVSSIGDFAGKTQNLDPSRMSVKIGDRVVFDNSSFLIDNDAEVYLNGYFRECSMPEQKGGFPPHFENLKITVDLRLGSESVKVFGSDLSYEYVRENADYRS
ncbi:MAG: bifunctional ornithine acetyltransferase/N-acetylglutamate synthase [Spirochaetales bacterium]|nr:bifunctional ornithine acetyltransferase/N-acetylglutamate synthase [Spirochaetales bacterium]